MSPVTTCHRRAAAAQTWTINTSERLVAEEFVRGSWLIPEFTWRSGTLLSALGDIYMRSADGMNNGTRVLSM